MFLRNMKNLVLVMAPVMLFVFVYSNFIQKPKADPLTYVGAGDPAMAAAREQGRATLPTFLERLENPAPDESHFGVKFRLDHSQVILPQPGAFAPADEAPAEYIWARGVHANADGSAVTGFLDGDPRTKGFHSGQPVVIQAEDIVDWGYSKGGVMEGNFTTKALLARMPAAEAARARAVMGWRDEGSQPAAGLTGPANHRALCIRCAAQLPSSPTPPPCSNASSPR
jgi:uncharacterized protein YegJ (DUF2314 family)